MMGLHIESRSLGLEVPLKKRLVKHQGPVSAVDPWQS